MSEISNQILSQQGQQEPTTQESASNEQQDLQNSSEKVVGETEIKEDPRLSVLAKLERKIKQKEQELNHKLKEIEEKEKNYSSILEAAKKAKENPLEALKTLGWAGDLEALNKWALENLSDDEIDPISKKIKSLEEQLRLKEKEFEEKIKRAIEEKEKELLEKENKLQVESFKKEIKAYLSANKEDFEFLSSQENAQELVFDLIVEDAIRQQRSGKPQDKIVPMSIEDASKKIEAYLEEQVESILKSNKVQSKLGRSVHTISKDMTPSLRGSVSELPLEERVNLAIQKLKAGKYPSD